jgi:hypothetical protein
MDSGRRVYAENDIDADAWYLKERLSDGTKNTLDSKSTATTDTNNHTLSIEVDPVLKQATARLDGDIILSSMYNLEPKNAGMYFYKFDGYGSVDFKEVRASPS